MSDDLRDTRRRQLEHREQQLADAIKRHQAAAQAEPPSDEALSQTGSDWLRTEAARLRDRRPTITRREDDEP